MKKRNSLWKDRRGSAVVEATILFPVIIMVFAGLVLLAQYLPTRSLLQRGTQYAATAIATEQGDSWLRHDAGEMKYYWADDSMELGNVYSTAIRAIGGTKRQDAANAETIVTDFQEKSLMSVPGELEVTFGVANYVVYKEIIVTATQTITPPVDLSFVGFPDTIPITVTSSAVVQNGDEFVRNIDLAADLVTFLSEEFKLDKMFDSVGKLCQKFNDVLGI